MISPNLLNIISPFEFKGHSFLQLEGQIDYGNMEKNNCIGSFYAEDAGPDRLIFEDVYFTWSLINNQLTFSDIRGYMEGGPFTGSLQIEELDRPTNSPYYLTLNVQGSNLKDIVDRNFELGENPYSGDIFGHVNLSGEIEPLWPKSLNATGQLRIEDGYLFKMPLLFGLSKYLSKMFFGFGYAKQKDFETKFEIHNEKFHFIDSKLKGTLLSVEGAGSIGFNQSVNIKVQVRPLKEGLIADVFRTILSLVTKLFEFKLTGTLEDAQWRPENLPKEVFLKFN